MTDALKPLRDALEAGPTDGPWWIDRIDSSIWIAANDQEDGGDVICNPPDSDLSASLKRWPANATYIAAANPATIRALLAERDALLARLDAAEADAKRWRHGHENGFMFAKMPTNDCQDAEWLSIDDIDATLSSAGGV